MDEVLKWKRSDGLKNKKSPAMPGDFYQQKISFFYTTLTNFDLSKTLKDQQL
jgi:hypothetical protein